MDENNIFAIRMKEARSKKEMSQAELSRITGIAPATLSSYEKGKNPPIDKAALIAKSLNVSLDWICGNDTKENVSEEVPFSDIAKTLLFLLKINGISYAAGKVNEFGYIPEEETLGYIFIDSYAIYNFLNEFLRIRNILEDDSYPQYLKNGLIKTVIDKYSKYYFEQGKIKSADDEKYNDFHGFEEIPF